MAKEIRFVVGSRDDVRSSVWRLWSQGDNLFLAARATASLTKISFHASGIYRYALNSQSPRPALVRWNRTLNSEPGVTPIFDIIAPALPGPDRFQERLPPAEKKVEFLRPPGVGKKLIIRIFLVDPAKTENDLRKSAGDMTLWFHGSVPMRRETAMVFSYLDDFKIEEVKFVLKTLNDVKFQLAEAPKNKHFYVHVIEIERKRPAATPHLVDLQTTPRNIEIIEKQVGG